MLVRILAVIVYLSVCVPDTHRHCIKTAKHGITQTTPRDSQGTVVTACGQQTVPNRGVVRSCDPLKFWGLQSYY